VAALIAAPSAIAQTRTAGPEFLTVFSDRMRMGARIVTSVDGALAAQVATTDWLRLELGFITSGNVAPGKVRLRCDIRFVGPDAASTAPVQSSLCWQGDLADVAGQWVPMTDGYLRFHPQAGDINGPWVVRVEVQDELSTDKAVLTPTYHWTGGTK
jgi:hypothetical protein